MNAMTQAQYNANLTVNKFRGNVSEFPMLKGILCLDHGYEYDQAMRVTAVIDLMVIAYRMDDLAKGRTIIGPLYYSREQAPASPSPGLHEGACHTKDCACWMDR